MKRALEDVFVIFQKNDIEISIPVKDADIKTSRVFFNASATLINSMVEDNGRTVSKVVVLRACSQAGKDSAHLGQLHVASSVSYLRWGRMNSPGQEVPFKVTNLEIGRYVYVLSS